MPVAKFEVIRDTREKPGQGWTFRKSTKCDGTIVQTLKTGDYSIVGLEDPAKPNSITVERKASIGELAGNLSKSDLPRFERELTRMKEFTRSFVVLEFTFDDLMRWPATSGLGWAARKKIKTTGAYILKVLLQVMARHPHVQWVFAGKHGQAATLAILKQAWADFGRG